MTSKMTSKSSSWRHEVRHDVKDTLWRPIIRHIKTFVMTSKSSSCCQQYVMRSKSSLWYHKYFVTLKSSSRCQKVRHDGKIKVMPKSLSWCQHICHNVNNTSWRENVREQCHATPKSSLDRHTQTHSLNAIDSQPLRGSTNKSSNWPQLYGGPERTWCKYINSL